MEELKKDGEETRVMFGIIFKVTNQINGKIYIGQSKHKLSLVKSNLNSKSKTNNNPIHLAIKAFGINNFNFEQIDDANSKDELDNKQRYWIKLLDSYNPEKGYNSKKGQLLWKGYDCGGKTRNQDGKQNKEYRKNKYLENRDRELAKQKEFRLANPELVKKRKAEYHKRNREKLCRKAKEDRLANLEQVRAKGREWSRKNAEERKPYMKEWQEKNKEVIKEDRKEYYLKNKTKFDMDSKKRFLNRWLKLAKWTEEKYQEEKAKGCKICGSHKKIVFDHDHESGEFRELLCSRCNCFLDWALKFQPQIIEYDKRFKIKLENIPACERVKK